MTLLIAIALLSASALPNENRDRQVDRVALATQEKGISKFQALLKKYRRTAKEPLLLFQLADSQQQRAAVLFRLAHADSHRSGRALDLSHYQAGLRESISTLDRLIRFEDYAELAHAIFLRGHAYEELEDRASATQDYERLVARWPDAEDSPSAWMSLADFSIDAGNHEKALGFLREIEKLPGDPHYPFAIYKMAWAYYNLKKIPDSLRYAATHIAYYRQHLSETSEQALLENSLLDTASFYFEGVEEGSSCCGAAQALAHFKKLENGPFLGKMLLRFSKLLRAHEKIESLTAFKNQVLQEEASRPEGIDIALLLHEYLQNHQDYAKIAELSRDFARVRKIHPEFQNFAAAEKALAGSADALQLVLKKNAAATDLSKYSSWLAQIDQSFTDLLKEGDPRIPKAHYNLAETLFTIRDFEGATKHYRWIVDQGLTQILPDSPLKAVAARYETLRGKGLIPKEVVARDLHDARDGQLPSELSEWMSWVENLGETQVSSENFLFESYRALYAQGHLVAAVEKLATFARRNPSSSYAPASANLALDTLMLSGQWNEARELAESIHPRKPAFAETLRRVAASSSYKILEAAYRRHDFKETLSLTERYLKNYAGSENDAVALSLSAGAALALNSRQRALNDFDRLIGDHPKSALARNALLDRAVLQEELYDLTAAADDYRAYADQSDAKTEIRRKSLMLAWVSGSTAHTKRFLADSRLCSKELREDCEKIEAMMAMAEPTGNGDAAMEHLKGSEGAIRAIWAAAALEQELSYRQKLTALRALASNWSDLDPIYKFSLLPHILISVPRTYAMAREEMAHLDPLRPKERWIVARVDALRELENVGAKVMKLPWKRIQGEVLEEVAMLYSDFSSEFRQMPVPKDLAKEEQATYQQTLEQLVGPFEKKGEELRSKAALFGSSSPLKIAATAKDLARLDPDFHLSRDTFAPRTVRVKTLFLAAVTSGNFALAAYYLQEAEVRALIPAGVIEAYQAAALASAGAKPEAQDLLEKLAPATPVRLAVGAVNK